MLLSHKLMAGWEIWLHFGMTSSHFTYVSPSQRLQSLCFRLLFIYFCISFKGQGLIKSICICLLFWKLQLLYFLACWHGSIPNVSTQSPETINFRCPCPFSMSTKNKPGHIQDSFSFIGDKATLRSTGLGNLWFCPKKKKKKSWIKL